MKKLSLLLIAILLVSALIPLAACGETKQYKDFYAMTDPNKYEVAPPDGYEYFKIEIIKYKDSLDFYVSAGLWSVSLYVYGKPDQPLVFWYREVIGEGWNGEEHILTLTYTNTAATPQFKDLLIASQQQDQTHQLYEEVLQNAQQAYSLVLPAVNNLIAQISNGQYNSVDQLRTAN